MTNPSYDIEKVYKEFVTISGYFEVGNNGQLTVNQKYANLIDKYCDYGNKSGKGNCSDHFQMVSSGVINLLKDLKNKHHLEDDKLAEYAILWLCYILKLYLKDKLTNLSEFYTNYIEKNKCYNDKINGDNGPTYKAIIDKKKKLMDNNEISKFNDIFNILYFLYYEISDKHPDCNTNLKSANDFAKEFKKLNEDSNHIIDSPFSQILSTLSDDYNNLQKKCTKFPSIQELKPKKSSAEKSAKGDEQITLQTLEGTSSSSSTLNTVIPVLSTFAIPVFLGVAYKYSLFGFDKLFQRQYLRNKLKKVKNKMELNI
ncbi:CIR protein [Plasmodium chabaudi chabaudi]|uniref:CIR protein n=1 Tax=Plasmodium chabaudi chabaudi TaxID=31271 RepID=A0A1C6WDE8_PLACU|nr:CIR protein [Plasmodium chabaudi chabaudi]